ncbi:MAG TPA: alpha-glucan family phosphorylase [Pyrinomonadaceae bacterium]|nr:alpha-glucan family phosphorylase [Pyrinomonadaceae bacterium]
MTVVETNQTSVQTSELPFNLQALETLSKNLWWSWTSDGASVFRNLDPHLWEQTEQNPRRLLQEISALRLWQAAADAAFVGRVENLASRFEDYLAQDFQSFGSDRKITPENPVAYFCAEYGVHNSLPLYSGGLGILAGDHLKSASDLRLPLVAIGLFYRFGYFRQKMSADGYQLEDYQESKAENLAIAPVLDANGERVKVSIRMRGRDVAAQAWLAEVGRVKLYLLDTNIEENDEIDRLITGHLYGGDKETRVVQEMLLGIGGVRLLRKLNIEPSVFHLNEGHSAFLTLELAREQTGSERKLSFADAVEEIRQKCVFTTHTPIAAGNDEFSAEMVEKCFDVEFFDALGLSFADFLALGRTNPANEHEWFGMTPLSIRMCRSSNGVSRKHGEVSRSLWQKMFAPAHLDDVPITHVTNGVHAPTWIAPALKNLYEKHFGADWAQFLESEEIWTQKIERISDEEIWRVHNLLKNSLVAFVRQKHGETLFDPAALTIGFARRVAGYKRWNLILSEPERLLDLIDTAERPVQFIFAGKAHPQDLQAKAVLQQIVASKAHSTWARRAVFLEDYDQEVARYLVQGVDVWLNVPRRPLEASGTSGEKVAMNGGLNFSILDGWWIEGYDGMNGWAIGDEHAIESDEKDVDVRDASALYSTLETEIVPEFYERDDAGLPRKWITRMRRALENLTPQFSSDRMVRDYINQIYL